MRKYLAILKKNYEKESIVSEFFFVADDDEVAVEHINNLISRAKKEFDVEIICIFLEEVR